MESRPPHPIMPAAWNLVEAAFPMMRCPVSRLVSISLLTVLLLALPACTAVPPGRVSGNPGRDYALSPIKVRDAVLDTLRAMGMELAMNQGDRFRTEWTDFNSLRIRGLRATHPERVQLRVEIRGGGEHSTVLAEARHEIETRQGLRSEWHPHPSRGLVEDEFLDRLDIRCGVVQ